MLPYKRVSSAIFLLALFFIFPLGSKAQDNVITGKVTDADGKPLGNVSVLIKGTAAGTTTSSLGVFRITAPKASGNVLVFSSVDFIDKEVTQSAGIAVNVQLERTSNSLNEVVVVGYGTQKRKDITGSVVSVDRQRLEDMPNTNFGQAIEGALPGVAVTTTGGGAEGDNEKILIRGQKSIKASTDPLIILDGIPFNGSMSDIPTTDIGSIDVLKDASAAAIYGSRGSNGVILITTKKGRSGKPVISYSGYTGLEKIANLPPTLSPEQFYQFKVTREGQAAITTSEQAVYDSKNFPDWVKLATQTGVKTHHALSVSGGNESVKYFASVNYLDSKGVAVNDNFKQLSTRVNLEATIAKWLTYGTNSGLTYDNRAGLPADFSGDDGAYFFNPLTTAYDSLGKLTIYPWPQDVHFGNPLAPTLAQSADNGYNLFTTNYLQVKFPFVKGLGYRLNTGVEHHSRDISTYYGRNTLDGLSNNGDLSTSNSGINDYTVENILTYDRTFKKHSISFTGLYSYERDLSTANLTSAKQFPSDVLTAYQANVALSVHDSAAYTKRTLISQMARLNYGYDNRYLLTLTGRRDGSSVFGVNDKYAFFPSVAVGWNIINEAFMDRNKIFSNLKLRLSYGLNGNQAISPYETLAALTNRTYIDGIVTLPGYVPSTLDNPDLHWETTKTTNIGLDFGLFSGRIQGTIDYYDAQTSDLLLDRQISPVQGISTITQNIGKTSNQGIELSLGTVNIKTKDFTWSSSGNISLNRNKIVELYGDGKNDTLNNWYIGHPINVDFGYVFNGIWQQKEDTLNTPQGNVHPGSAKIKDINGDGVINSYDRTILGNLQPSFTWGLANNFKYKGFGLYVFIQGVEGISQVNDLLNENFVQSGVRHNTVIKDWWTPSNPTNSYWANSLTSNNSPSAVAIVQSSSYVRVKDISLSYEFGERILQGLGLSKLRVYVETRNPFTFTKWVGLDPEVTNQNTIPLQKEYVLGLNVSL